MFGYDPSIRLYSPYYSRLEPYGMLKFARLDQIYDYTGADYDWYTEPMAHGNRWVGPFWGEAGKTYLTTYSALFYSVDPATGARLKNGVVVIDISMKQIKDIIESLRIGSARNTKIVETDSYRLENSVVVHWLFQADLRTQFDYSRYPLEIEHVGIQIQPLESDRNVFLVPDLGSYKMITPTLKPGLDAAIFLPGWEITDTFFNVSSG